MKNIIVFIFICFAFGFTMEQNPISVEAFDEQRNNSSQLLIESGEMIIGDVRSILQNNIWSFSW